MSVYDAIARAQSKDVFGAFLFCDMEEGATFSYFGYQTMTGAWLIKRLNTTNGEMRYCAGVDAYDTAWTNRATQTYSLPAAME